MQRSDFLPGVASFSGGWRVISLLESARAHNIAVIHQIPQSFKPAWWCRSGHAQTIWAATLRVMPSVPLKREQWETPDGDFLNIDRVSAKVGQPTLIVLHGLEGSSATTHVRGFLRAAFDLGWQGLGVNFRSCGGEPNRLRRFYHGGETTDLHWIIERLSKQDPNALIFCVGISLGGNVLLKYLGEQADGAPAQLRAAAAISTPFDLAASAHAFEKDSFNRIYMRRLVRSLKQKAFHKLKRYPDLADHRRLAAVRTIVEFDEVVTAPLNGFADAKSYWQASSSKRFLASIRRPALLINAMDDPLVPADSLPRQEEVAKNPRLSALFTEAGGHVGFVAGEWPNQPLFWAQESAIYFLTEHMKSA